MQKLAATGRFAGFIVRENKRFLLLVVQQQTAKRGAEFFLHTFQLENEVQTSVKKYRAVTFY